MTKWLCKIFDHKWNADGIINNGVSDKDGMNHGYVNWSCLRCKTIYSEGITFQPYKAGTDILTMMKRAKTKPYLGEYNG